MQPLDLAIIKLWQVWSGLQDNVSMILSIFQEQFLWTFYYIQHQLDQLNVFIKKLKVFPRSVWNSKVYCTKQIFAIMHLKQRWATSLVGGILAILAIYLPYVVFALFIAVKARGFLCTRCSKKWKKKYKVRELALGEFNIQWNFMLDWFLHYISP